MKYIKTLPSVEEFKDEYPLTKEQKRDRQKVIEEIKGILSGKAKKKLLIIGPCSADREDAVVDYMYRLVKVSEKVKDVFCIIPRIYTAKPRTAGVGYKGLMHRPNITQENDNVYNGLIASRKLHLHVICETGMFGADEMLYSESSGYIDDVVAYMAVGARSVEDQQHRLVASGLDLPVGMKNPTCGDFHVMLNAVKAAQSPQSLIYHGWECRTDGNMFTHAILRGYIDRCGRSHSNYHFDSLIELHDMYIKENLRNMGVVIDCNHENSHKQYDDQRRIAKDVFLTCKMNKSLDAFIKGLMIESYLVDGCQHVGGGIYGKSITDPCLGWDKTEKMIYELAEVI